MSDTITAPRPTAQTSIERSLPFTMRATNGPASDGLTLSGLAAVFGQKTRIDSWEGTFDESIRKGAFSKTFKERTPVMQFDHGRHPLVGSIPIGAFSAGFPRETDAGVEVEARLLDNWLISPVRDAIANGSINGMSFRFEVVRDAWFDRKGKELSMQEVKDLLWYNTDPTRLPLHRELIEVKAPEMGPVVFPAYSGTDVSVRAHDIAYEIRSNPDNVRQLRGTLYSGIAPVVAMTQELASEVARALLFDLPDHKSAQLARIRSAWSQRALTPAETLTLTGLLAQLAAADAGVDPIVDALCEADCALDDAQTIIAGLLGLPDPDAEEMDGTDMPNNNQQGMGANSATDKATPRDDAPGKNGNNDAPSIQTPVLTSQQIRAKYVRDSYVTRQRVGKVTGN